MLYIKKWIFIALLVVGFVSSLSSEATSASDTKTPKLSDILQQLDSKGYTNIQDVEYDHGILIVEGINDNGIKFELHLDPKTGAILKQQHHLRTRLSIIDIAKQIEAKGYITIDEIEFDEGIYKVEAVNKNEEKIEMRIDPNTGKEV